MFAFRGIEATLFTGIYPNQHGIWAEYDSPSDQTNRWVNLSDLILKNKVSLGFRGICSYLVEKFDSPEPPKQKKAMFGTFNRSLSKRIDSPNILSAYPTVFDIARKMNFGYWFFEPAIGIPDRVVVQLFFSATRSNFRPLNYLKLGALDEIGHIFGPDSLEIQKGLKIIDSYIEKITKHYTRIAPDGEILILSDHGMDKVLHTVNIAKELSQIPRGDFLAFIDSTMIRIWPLKELIETQILDFLDSVSWGTLINQEKRKEMRIPESPPIIFAFNPGTVAFPDDFWNKRPPKGMHGYVEPLDCLKGSPFIATTLTDFPQIVTFADVGNRLMTFFKN
jgi:hypothetical protein